MHDAAETVWEMFQPPPNNQIAWAARQPEIVGGGLDSLASLRAFAKRYGRDCYFTPNPVVAGFRTRPSTAHITHIRCVVLDLDPTQEVLRSNGDGTNDGRNVGETYSGSVRLNVRESLLTHGIPWSGIEERVLAHAENLLGFQLHPDRVDSGRGRQLWLRFDPVPVSTQEEKSQWRRAVGAFLHRLDQDLGVVGSCRLDTSCCDLPRLVRLPGTINTKTGRIAQFLGIGTPDDRIRTSILERFGLDAPQGRPPSVGSGDWRPMSHWLSLRAKQFLNRGCPEPGRHAAAFATAASMRDLGASYEATEMAVLRGAGKCSPPLSTYEATRCVRNAFKEGLIGS